MADWQVIHGNCLEVLRSMESESVDAVVTDPPYSSGGMFRGDRSRPPENKYVNPVEVVRFHPTFSGDTMDQRAFFVWAMEWWSMCRRVLRPGGFAATFTDWRQLPVTSDAFQAGGLIWRGIVVWDKGKASRPSPGRFRQQTEFILWGTNGAILIPKTGALYPEGVVRATPFHGKHHIAGKPVSVMRHLLSLTPPGGIVLDPFAGSGTTGVACVLEGRGFVGIECEAGYVEIARKRIADAAAQLDL